MNRTTALISAGAAFLVGVGIVIGVNALTHTPEAATQTPTTAATTAPAATTTTSPRAPGTITAAPSTSTPKTTPQNSSAGLPSVPDLNEQQRRDPAEVAAAFIVAITEFDTAIDTDRTGGAARGKDLMTEELAFALTTPDPAASTAQWAAWTQAGAWATTDTYLTQIPWLPADTRTTAVRAIGYVVTIHYGDGRTEIQPQQTLAVTMTRTDPDQPWLVSATEVP